MALRGRPEVVLLLLLLISISHVLAEHGRSHKTTYEALEVINKSPTELIEMRGFKSEAHVVQTRDKYFIHLARIIHPLLPHGPTKRPIIFNHGLMESGTIFLINSRDAEPKDLSQCHESLDHLKQSNDSFYRNGPMMLANYGYDVWLLSMRGTEFTLPFQTKDVFASKFWDYSLDEFELFDVPAAIDYIRSVTKADKIGYIGHSQATFVALALLANKPDYARILEPVVLIAPVSYIYHTKTIARPALMQEMIYGNHDIDAPFPVNAPQVRNTVTDVCKRPSNRVLCQVMNVLVSGFGERWLTGYYSHFPFFSSLRNIHHFGQLLMSRRFQRFDYGLAKNLRIYKNATVPQHPIENIRSTAITLVYSNSDTLATTKDIKLLKQRLKVPLNEIRVKKKHFNHFDLVFAQDADKHVFKPMLKVLEGAESSDGACSSRAGGQMKASP